MKQDISEIDRNFKPVAVAEGMHWYDARSIGVEGQGWSVDQLDSPYDRFPARAKAVLRDPVWRLSQNSAGICVRFVTDATTIAAKWTVRHEPLAMKHMPATGMSGLDLYARVNDKWRYAGTGLAISFPENSGEIISNLVPGRREFRLYLPLYNGVTRVQVGINEGASIQPAPKHKRGGGKPVVFYGTSVVQGGCANRAGMGYPEIIARMINVETINLGFSGSAQMEPELSDLLCELDPCVYVLDAIPNMQEEWIGQRVEPFIKKLRMARPDTPIVQIEHIRSQKSFLQNESQQVSARKNAELRKALQRLKDGRVVNLHLVPHDDLFGDDTLGTVDGLHATDLGFLRMSQVIGPVVDRLVK